jgi:hypothetical protein
MPGGSGGTRTYAISWFFFLSLLRVLRRRREGGGDDGEEEADEAELIYITSDGSCSSSRPRGWSDGRLSDGEGRNKGVFDKCRGETRDLDDDERLEVSKGGAGLYHAMYAYMQAE